MPVPHAQVLNQDGLPQLEAGPVRLPPLKFVGPAAFSIACVIVQLTISLSFLSEAAAQTHLQRTTTALPRFLLGAQADHDLNRRREGNDAVAIGLINPTNLGDGPYYGYGDYNGGGDYFTDIVPRCRD